ncbi:hypothetical protein RchiOBHm_Chr3g0490461 [Rosa chinensis]|uniref:Uncharacterized protein n=1 Tax=Rosa chinensis TaxID=74649 RepID=A0A2P6RG00_ROSCH|nr:hypothetical protein RchiOBHm_Chr3g0490461 [Rosa chinensis]
MNLFSKSRGSAKHLKLMRLSWLKSLEGFAQLLLLSYVEKLWPLI